MLDKPYAMQLTAPNTPLVPVHIDLPCPGQGEVLIEIEACGVCRTDLHVMDGELPDQSYPIVPGHEIVGRVVGLGKGTDNRFQIGQRLGVPWLGHTCGACQFCQTGRENLCDEPLFTGYTRDGGFATHCVADAAFAFKLDPSDDAASLAPLLCAGLIGYRTLAFANNARRVGIYGFGAAAHIVCQIAVHQGRQVFAFVRPGDQQAADFARKLGAVWAGASDELPETLLDAALIFAPVGELVPHALRAVQKGGHVICGGIHMSDIPSFPYADLWHERKISSVANLTRADGEAFFPLAKAAGVVTETTTYPLQDANTALDDLRYGRIQGAAVLVP